MFLTIVAGVFFAFFSVIFLFMLWDVRPTQANNRRRELKKSMERLAYGRVTEYNFWRVLVAVVIWALSGWYIFP